MSAFVKGDSQRDNSLVRNWDQLPGPSDFLNEILEALRIGESIIVVFPRAPSSFATRVCAGMLGHGFHDWSREEIEDITGLSTKAPNDIVWVEVVRSDKHEEQSIIGAFRDYLKNRRPMRVILFSRTRADEQLSKIGRSLGLTVFRWCDFVTSTDTEVYFRRIGHQNGFSANYSALMASIIARKIGGDLFRAKSYNDIRLRDLLSGGSLAMEHSWAGQVGVLFPVLDYHRSRIIQQHRSRWQLKWWKKKMQISVEKKDALELSHLLYQAEKMRSPRMSKSVIDDLEWLVEARNRLAHGCVVSWELCSNSVGRRLLGFSLDEVSETRASGRPGRSRGAVAPNLPPTGRPLAKDGPPAGE